MLRARRRCGRSRRAARPTLYHATFAGATGSASHGGSLDALEAHVRSASRLVVLTGAGISTPSGIPDYRSPDGSYSRGHKPITHAEFVRKAENRQRYWARSFIGFEVFSRSRPNAAHLALAELERGGWIGGGCITQNVDGLHAAAGMRDCLDLHGRIDAVECLDCGDRSDRAVLQERLRAANREWAARRAGALPAELRADGDAELTAAETAAFSVPSCEACGGGTLKPAVTFFGGSVPVEDVEAAREAAENADAMLVVGSSVQVYSAFRLVRAVAERGAPVALLNNGPTRADALAALHLHCAAEEVLPALASRLLARARRRRRRGFDSDVARQSEQKNAPDELRRGSASIAAGVHLIITEL